MKTNLTLTVLTVILFIALSFQANAQLTFEITAPAAVQGTYDVVPAAFGGPMPLCGESFTGDLMIVDDADDEAGDGSITDGCQMMANDLTDMVALIDRGACSFDLKCYHAQLAGATAVVMCNNIIGDPPIIMGVASQDTADMITIPCMMLSYDDCQTIRMEIPTVSMNLTFIPADPGDDVVLWDGGSFNGGLDGWSTTGISDPAHTWSYVADGASGGPFAGGNVIESPTVCNGAMVFDSGLISGPDVAGPPYPQNNGELISPTIDCSDFTAVSLKFHQHLIGLNSNSFDSPASFAISFDDGVTWETSIEITTENILTSLENVDVGTEVKRFLLPQLVGEPTVKIKFTWDGDFYFWLLDDVQLIEPEAHNMQVTNFYGQAQNAQTPLHQVSNFGFVSDIENIGGTTQSGVNLNITIVNDGTSAVVYTDDLAYGDIEPDSLAENIAFGGFTPAMETGFYTGTYTLTADSTDFDPSNNTSSFTFVVTDSTFAKETEISDLNSVRPATAEWVNEPHSWTYGNYYHTPNGDGFKASSATIAFDASAVVGESVTIWLYEWTDTNADEMVDEGERTRIGFNNMTFDGSEPVNELMTVPLLSFLGDNPSDPIPLADGGEYVLMMEFITESQDAGIDLEIAFSDEYDYAGATWLTLPDDPTTDFFEGGEQGSPRFGPVLGIGTETSFSTVGFGRDFCPVVRLNVVEDVVATQELSAENVFEVFPVPANDYINVKLELVDFTEQAVIKIMDANGKVIMNQKHQGIQNELFKYDVNNLAAGNYFIQIQTEEGNRTKPFMIQR